MWSENLIRAIVFNNMIVNENAAKLMFQIKTEIHGEVRAINYLFHERKANNSLCGKQTCFRVLITIGLKCCGTKIYKRFEYFLYHTSAIRDTESRLVKEPSETWLSPKLSQTHVMNLKRSQGICHGKTTKFSAYKFQRDVD